tara:strand:+ start:7 stop:1152 length:1146 start_codon:yes stop_codon:yes gene_type:complete
MTRASDLARLIGAGATINDGTTITTDDNNPQLTLISTDDDGDRGPVLRLQRDSASPADNDILGRVQFTFDDDAGNETAAVQIEAQVTDVSNGSEDSRLQFNVLDGGANREFMRMTGSEGIVINEEGEADLDFRVESNNQANMLLVDGGNDTVSFQPNSGTLTIKAGSGDATNNVRLEAGGTTSTYLEYRGYLGHQFYVDTTERMRISSNGRVLVGATSDTGFRIVSTASGTEGCLDCVSSSTNGYYALRIDMHANNNYAQLFRQGGSVVGTILTSSGSTSYNTSSDYRLKENVTYEFDATSRLKQLKPCRFNFKIDADKTKDGFLAHEVQTIVPEAVSGEKDAVDADGNIDPQGIDQSKLVPLLVKTIQELEARITALESK